jgi:putative DNA primase/helicase
LCPVHADKSPSLGLADKDGKTLFKCRVGCTQESVIEKLKALDLWPTGNGHTNGNGGALTLNAFAKAKGLDSQFLARCGVTEEKGSLVFHYSLMNGQRAPRQRVRLALEGEKRFIWNKANGRPVPYGLWRIGDAHKRGIDTLVLCEGESDALTFWSHKLEALGIPGSDNAGLLQAPHVARFQQILIVHESDQGGEVFEKGCVARLAELEYPGRVAVVEMERAEVNDVNELHLKTLGDPGGFEAEWLALVDQVRSIDLPIVGLEVFDASMVQPKPIKWLWPKRVPCGKLALLVGPPGLGKSFVALDIAAHLTNGSPWPDGTANAFDGDIIIFSAEDGMADTIIPRLIGLGAKRGRIFIGKRVRELNQSGEITRRGFNLAHDLPKLERMLDQHPETKLVIIDPVSAYMARIDTHKNAEIRSEVLDPLAELAERRDVTIIAVTHFNKGGGGGGLERISGSIAFPAAARIVWGFARDAEDPGKRLMLFGKSNVGPEVSGLAFRITENPDGSPSFEWLAGSVNENLADALRREQEAQKDTTTASKLELAKSLWRQMLADGPRLVKEIEDRASELNISEKTLKRASWDLGVRRSKKGFTGGWMAHLPTNP